MAKRSWFAIHGLGTVTVDATSMVQAAASCMWICELGYAWAALGLGWAGLSLGWAGPAGLGFARLGWLSLSLSWLSLCLS